jgi:hypothetical protein
LRYRKTQGVFLMKSLRILAIAVAIVALPLSLHAQSVAEDTTTADAGQQEAMHMVPANGALLKTIDASKIESGNEFQVKLAKTVRLENGPELRSGTILVGTIVKDNDGTAKLTLRITQAKLKDGSVVPIKATIVGVASPGVDNFEGYSAVAGSQEPNNWTDQTLQTEQINAAPHADLHSDIASADSGVFLSTDNRDVKIPAGSEIKLAVAPSKSE